ncbi:hypothetical protein E1264_38110 [Actinomadura sp. KC216]|uniref:hypothetical protein n=1 Tax=Actinomadura sp. KC216 TaxID=2530370 RepID=UPI001050732F|nr:hypothetical protein [Actinomadura sp. KC216]TDB76804.1 hypothetical protein E1264_38110 [Actinomadura sp. KC216]
MTNSVFAKYADRAWPYHFAGTLRVRNIAGGIPSDPTVAEGWLKTKLADKDDLIREAVATTMAERGITAEEAAKEVDKLKHLNGFKRDEQGLYIEGRQLKAATKEATSVAYSTGKLLNNGKNSWGRTSKGIHSFVAEHVMVVEERLHLGIAEPTGITQRFVHTYRGSGIQYEEYVEDAKIDFTIATDYGFTEEQWAMIWLTGEQQGIGASRSQGFGRYEVVRWDRA